MELTPTEIEQYVLMMRANKVTHLKVGSLELHVDLDTTEAIAQTTIPQEKQPTMEDLLFYSAGDPIGPYNPKDRELNEEHRL